MLECGIKLESAKRTSDGSVVYPITVETNKKWFSQHILSITEEDNVMTVGELIKQLQKLDPTMPVKTQTGTKEGGVISEACRLTIWVNQARNGFSHVWRTES